MDELSPEIDQKNIFGVCKLCLKQRELKRSHVWPSFLYKDYIADMSKGGQVIAVSPRLPEEIRQVVRYWLCEGCEKNFGEAETFAAQLMKRIKKNPRKQHTYDEAFFRYVISICWRIMHYQHDMLNNALIESAFPACRAWRRYLHKEINTIGDYTPHVFVIFDDVQGMHKILSAQLVLDNSLLITQAGPLLIVARLSHHFVDRIDERLWRRSEVKQFAGTLSVIEEWHVGRDLSLDLMRAISAHFQQIVKMVKDNHIARMQRKIS